MSERRSLSQYYGDGLKLREKLLTGDPSAKIIPIEGAMPVLINPGEYFMSRNGQKSVNVGELASYFVDLATENGTEGYRKEDLDGFVISEDLLTKRDLAVITLGYAMVRDSVPPLENVGGSDDS